MVILCQGFEVGDWEIALVRNTGIAGDDGDHVAHDGAFRFSLVLLQEIFECRVTEAGR